MIHLEFLNVGFGLSILAYTGPKDPVLVIDGGDDRPTAYSPRAISLARRLEQLGAGEIGLMVATHPHRDHIGGLAQAVKNCPVREFVTPFAMEELSPAMNRENPMGGALAGYRDLWDTLKKQNASIQIVEEAQLQWGSVELLIHRPAKGYLHEARRLLRVACQTPTKTALAALDASLNNACMVLELRALGTRVLLPGDVSLGWWQETDLQSLGADIFALPHHGDQAALSPELLAAVKPRYAVVSADTRGTWGLPHPAIEGMLAAAGCREVCYTAGGREEESAFGVRFVLEEGGKVRREAI